MVTKPDRAQRKQRGGSADLAREESVREKIRTSQLANRLIDHANGEVNLEPTQVKAIEILLRKTLPDLAATETKLTVETRPAPELTNEQLLRIAGEAVKEIKQLPGPGADQAVDDQDETTTH